jgi:hypothetical protein
LNIEIHNWLLQILIFIKTPTINLVLFKV